jgi:AbrB family looped-hinge helix DNA binding protein
MIDYRVLPRSKVTSKYQVTIPKEVREKVGVKAGEVVSVEALSQAEIRLRRFPSVSNPLEVLIGRKRFSRTVPVEELEERIEFR